MKLKKLRIKIQETSKILKKVITNSFFLNLLLLIFPAEAFFYVKSTDIKTNQKQELNPQAKTNLQSLEEEIETKPVLQATTR